MKHIFWCVEFWSSWLCLARSSLWVAPSVKSFPDCLVHMTQCPHHFQHKCHTNLILPRGFQNSYFSTYFVERICLMSGPEVFWPLSLCCWPLLYSINTRWSLCPKDFFTPSVGPYFYKKWHLGLDREFFQALYPLLQLALQTSTHWHSRWCFLASVGDSAQNSHELWKNTFYNWFCFFLAIVLFILKFQMTLREG